MLQALNDLKLWLFCLLEYPSGGAAASSLISSEINKFYALSKLVHSVMRQTDREAKRVQNDRVIAENELKKEVKLLEASILKIHAAMVEVRDG